MLCFDRNDVTSSLVLSLHGELDVVSTPPVRASLQAAYDSGAREVVLDLAEVTFVDAATLGLFVGAHRRLSSIGGRFVLRDPKPPVRHVLEVTGLDRVLEVVSAEPAR